MVVYNWARYGGYEVSSKGDKRFSAFNAIMYDGRSIEEHYQCDVKGYDPGGRNWRLGKGKPPLILHEDLWLCYLNLWRTWAKDNRHKLKELKDTMAPITNILSDCFANSNINQARALATILNEMEI